MSDTKIFTKATFIKLLQAQLEDDQIIVLTGSLEGTISVNTKRNVKKVTFGFAADAFRRKGDIGHFAFGATPAFAFAIVNKEDASDLSISLAVSIALEK